MKTQSRLPFNGNIVILGFGSIAQAVLPLLFQLIKLTHEKVTVISRSQDKKISPRNGK